MPFSQQELESAFRQMEQERQFELNTPIGRP